MTFPPRFIDPAQEHLYRETLSRRFRINARVGTTLTLVCTLGFTLFNRSRSVGVFDAELIARLDVVRFGVLLPLLIACCAGTFVARLERFNRLMAWGSLLVCMLVLGWVLVHVPEASRPPLRDAMLMVLLFLPLYELGLLLSVAAIAAIASTALWALGEVNQDLWKAAPVITITAFVGVMVAWVIELRARRDFATLQSVRDASASLASTNVRLAQLLAERQRQLRSAAHDLRNPLTSILVNSEVLGTEPGTDPSAMAADLQAAAHRMKEMLTHMLEMERQVAVVADFGEVVHQSVGALRGLAQAKGQVVHLDVPARLPLPVRGASVELHGLIDNLLSNAIKYSPRASEIAVRVRAAEGVATVEVSDHGPGLSEEEAKSIFEPFRRGSAEPTAGEGSVGLGLSLSRQTATLLGGRLEAHSPGPGKGTTFTLTLPLAAANRPSASPG